MRPIIAIIATILVATLAAAQQKSYAGYKIIRVSGVQTRDRMDYITQFEDMDPDFDIWNIGKNENGEAVATIMLSPHAQSVYIDLFKSKNYQIEVLSENVQEIIDEEKRLNEIYRSEHKATSIHGKFFRYPELINFLNEIADENKDIVTLYTAGRSVENRLLNVIKINNGATKSRKIWIDCGIHAREWATPIICAYFIENFIKEYRSNAPRVVNLLNEYEFHILPLVNPDGYEYSHTNDRYWRKNRVKNTGSTCYGVDLNRNFDYYHATEGTSALPCAITWPGKTPASEPETQAVVSAISAALGDWIVLATVHSYGEYILFPYGENSALNPPNYARLLTNGNTMAAAIKAQYGENFSVGKSSALLYTTSGSTSDWGYVKAGIPIAYTVEVRPHNTAASGNNGFVLKEQDIPFNNKEVYEGLLASFIDSSGVAANSGHPSGK